MKETNVCSGQLQTDENFESSITEIRCYKSVEVQTFGQVDFQSGALIFYRHFTHTQSLDLVPTYYFEILMNRTMNNFRAWTEPFEIQFS